jgi:hypothetical protein
MSIHKLISGRIRGTVKVIAPVNGAVWAQFRMTASDQSGDSLLCGCLVRVGAELEAVNRLSDGDLVAISSAIAMKTQTEKEGIERRGLDLLVHGTLCPDHAGRKRGDKPTAGGDL